MKSYVGEIYNITRHRNGICGLGFYTVIFGPGPAMTAKAPGARFLGTVFDETDDGECAVAVVAIDDLVGGDDVGCWRGDVFAAELRVAIKRKEQR